MDEKTAELKHFFDRLETGEMPSFLQMLQILSTVSEIMTDSDTPCIDCMSPFVQSATD